MSFAVFMEIFGYIGTTLVIISMLMTSVKRLRLLNLCGAVISMIYAITVGAWPVVLLNAALSVINLGQLIRLARESRRSSQPTNPSS